MSIDGLLHDLGEKFEEIEHKLPAEDFDEEKRANYLKTMKLLWERRDLWARLAKQYNDQFDALIDDEEKEENEKKDEKKKKKNGELADEEANEELRENATQAYRVYKQANHDFVSVWREPRTFVNFPLPSEEKKRQFLYYQTD